MISVYICEDEPKMLSFIETTIANYITIHNLDMQIGLATSKPTEIVDEIAGNHASSIYFLDVDLNDDTYTGFTLAKKIRELDPRGFIIFITSHEELSFETFRHRIEAMDYIVKGNPDTIKERIAVCLESIQERLLNEKDSYNPYYQIKILDRIYHIPIKEIMFFETSASKHKIVLHAQHETLEFFGKLSEIEETIGGTQFLRVHRSFLINTDNIQTIYLADNKIEMKNNAFCLLSRKGKKLLKELSL